MFITKFLMEFNMNINKVFIGNINRNNKIFINKYRSINLIVNTFGIKNNIPQIQYY